MALGLCLLAFDMFMAIKIKKMLIKENNDCAINLEKIDSEIIDILKKAKALTKESRLASKRDR